MDAKVIRRIMRNATGADLFAVMNRAIMPIISGRSRRRCRMSRVEKKECWYQVNGGERRSVKFVEGRTTVGRLLEKLERRDHVATSEGSRVSDVDFLAEGKTYNLIESVKGNADTTAGISSRELSDRIVESTGALIDARLIGTLSIADLEKLFSRSSRLLSLIRLELENRDGVETIVRTESREDSDDDVYEDDVETEDDDDDDIEV